MLTEAHRVALLKKLGIASGMGGAVDQFGGKAAADFGNFSDQPLKKSLGLPENSIPSPPDSVVARIQQVEASLKDMLVKKGKEIISSTETFSSEEEEFATKSKKIDDLIQVNYKGLMDAMKKAIKKVVGIEDTNIIERDKKQIFNKIDTIAMIAEIAIDQCSHGKRNIEDVVTYFNQLCDQEFLYEPPQVQETAAIEALKKTHLETLDSMQKEILSKCNNNSEIDEFLTEQRNIIAQQFDDVINSSDSPELKALRMEKISHHVGNKIFQVLNDIFNVRSQYDNSMPSSYNEQEFKNHGKETDRPVKTVIMWLEKQALDNLKYKDAPEILYAKLLGSLKGVEEPIAEYASRVEKQKETKGVDALQFDKEMKREAATPAKKSIFRKFFGNSNKSKQSSAESYRSLMQEISAMENTIEKCDKIAKKTKSVLAKYPEKSSVDTIKPRVSDLKLHSDKLVTVSSTPRKTTVAEEAPKQTHGRSKSR